MKNNKGFAPVLITIAVLAVLMAGGIGYYTMKNFKIASITQGNNSQQQLDKNNTEKAIVVNPDIAPLSNAIKLTLDDTNKNVLIAAGQTFTITLCNIGDGGYQFDTPEYNKSVLNLTSHKNIPTNEQKGVVGGCYGNDVFEFKAVSAGTSNLTITASRPWDVGHKLQQFFATITVK